MTPGAPPNSNHDHDPNLSAYERDMLALSDSAQRRVLVRLAQEPATSAQIAAATNLDPVLVERAVSHLVTIHLVERQADAPGREHLFNLAERVSIRAEGAFTRFVIRGAELRDPTIEVRALTDEL